MCRREQPASASAPATRALAVVVDPTVGGYEPSNAPLIAVVEGVEARPGRGRGGFRPGETGWRGVRKVPLPGAEDDGRGHDDRPPPLAPRSIRTAVGLPLRHRPPLAEACGSRTHLQLV